MIRNPEMVRQIVHMILKKSSKRELCTMGMKISHRVKIIPK